MLSHGKVTGETETAHADKDLIVRMMSGDDLPDMTVYEKKSPLPEIALQCSGVTAGMNGVCRR